MDIIGTEQHADELRKRRENIAMTLRHLSKERAELDHNTEWVSQDAYAKRAQLLSHVQSWYAAEIGQIDEALTQGRVNDYGLCVACGALIEQNCPQTPNESEFCSACQLYEDHEREL